MDSYTPKREIEKIQNKTRLRMLAEAKGREQIDRLEAEAGKLDALHVLPSISSAMRQAANVIRGLLGDPTP